jgi:hypothetical protein
MALVTEHDWYAYLQLPPQASTRDVEHAIERLSRQASALATTAPERSQQLRETIRSIKRDLLSGPEGPPRPGVPRAHDLAPPPVPSRPPGAAAPGQGAGSRLARFLRTGWTCPSCGKGAVPSEKFCTRCGTPIHPLRPETAAEPAHAPSPRPFCPGCANPLGAMDVFCSKCGARR